MAKRAGRAKRYDDEKKLNYKKVFAVLILFIVVIMFIVGIKKLFTTGMTSTGKITAVNYFPVYSNGKWGVISSNGKTVIEPQYEEMPVIPNNSQPLFVCTYDVDYEAGTYKTKVVDDKNSDIITGYDNVKFIDYIDENGELTYLQNMLIVQKDEKFGLVDLKNKEILDISYDEISILNGVDNSILIKKDNSVGICDYEGNIIINAEYKEIKAIGNSYKNGYITVNNEGLYGVIDFNKAVIFENKYIDIKPVYSSNKYAVKIDKAYKIIDKNGNILIDKSFEDIKDINDSNIIFKEKGKYGVIAINSENKIGAQYEDIIFMDNSNYIAKKSKSGVINSTNEVQLDFKYDSIEYNMVAGILIAKNSENKYDIYDSTKALKLTVDDIEIFDEYMTVTIGDEYKSYNFKFEEKDEKTLSPNNNDIVSNEKDGKYGFVNSKGKVVVKYDYDEVTELNKYGYAGVKQDGLWGVINAKGEIVIKPTYNLDKNEVIDFIGKWHKGIGAEYYTDI